MNLTIVEIRTHLTLVSVCLPLSTVCLSESGPFASTVLFNQRALMVREANVCMLDRSGTIAIVGSDAALSAVKDELSLKVEKVL